MAGGVKDGADAVSDASFSVGVAALLVSVGTGPDPSDTVTLPGSGLAFLASDVADGTALVASGIEAASDDGDYSESGKRLLSISSPLITGSMSKKLVDMMSNDETTKSTIEFFIGELSSTVSDVSIEKTGKSSEAKKQNAENQKRKTNE